MTMRNALILVLIVALVIIAAGLTLSTSQTPIVARAAEPRQSLNLPAGLSAEDRATVQNRLQENAGALPISQVAKLTAADAAAGDLFGWSVASNGDTLVVGAMADDDAGSESGSAYVFARNMGGPDNWGQVKKLNADDAAAADRFGNDVAISGDTLIIGAQFDADASFSAGAAYVFSRNMGGSDNWGQVKELNADDAAIGDVFGGSVAISGDTLVVGAYADDEAGDDSGSAYVFARNMGGPDNWGQINKLTATDAAAGDRFGFSVTISGDTRVVGVPFDNDAGNWSGAAYVYALRAAQTYLPLIIVN